MTEQVWDAVIVGGRCGGAALATYLARAGARVAMIEAAGLHTDQVVSTHTVHPPGMDILDELGVGDAVRHDCPPARVVRFQVDHAWADIRPANGRLECCPRRDRLDGLLQDAAATAGVEVIERTRVTELLRNGDRVTGVRAQRNGNTTDLRATITVGADGRHSTVAHLAGAEEYLGYEWDRGAYWAYWEPPSVWDSAAFPFDMLVASTGPHRRFIFPTDHGQVLMATVPERDRLLSWRGDHERHYVDDLRLDPLFEPLVRDGRMVSTVRGTLAERFYFRQSAGPGWALVGDAGHHKDPVIGWGIAEALVQAKHLAAAIQEGSDAALLRYWRQRDVDALPRFRLAQDRGGRGALSSLMPLVISRAQTRVDLATRLYAETEYDVNPYETMPVGQVARWVAAAAIRGRPGMIPAFLAQGRRTRQVQGELRQRKRLLDVAAAPTAV